jgi:hypothetical protein
LETTFFPVFFAIFAVELLFNQTTENAENAKKVFPARTLTATKEEER